MQHETKMENQSWLKKLARRLGPGHIVNLCFIVVLLFSTLLTWREVVVLEDAYISSQRNHLENVANALDKHLQYNVDKLIFLRNGMREALVAPLDFTSLRNAVTEFEQHRDEHAWQIELNRRRTLPVNGVSDALVSEGNLLSRENESLDNEITAALEVGYLLRLAHNSSSMVEQAVYVSRAGFYVSTLPTLFTRNVPTRYYGYVTQPWFIGHSQRENRHRAVRWFTSQPEHASNTEPQVTVSVPVDSNNYWYGVLGMSIPVRTWQLRSLVKAQCTWFRWKTTRSASGSLMKQGIRTVSLLRKQSNLIQPDWWETTSQNVLAHVDKNTISHIIRQSDDMVDNLFIMRFDLTFNITFMR